MSTNSLNTPPAFRFAVANHVFFAMLFGFSYDYYQQRLYTDSAYYIYHVVNNESLHIELYRFVLGFSQLVPLVLVKLGASLKTVLIGYSAGHVLYYYLIYYWVAVVRKEPVVATLLVLTQTVGIISGYFTPMFELYYSNGLLVIFYVWLKQYRQTVAGITGLLILAFFIATAHPMANVLLVFVLAFHACRHKLVFWREYLALLVVITAVFLFKVQTADAYEQGKSKAFADTLKHASFGWGYAQGFMRFLGTYYKDLLVLALAAVTGLVMHRKYRETAVFILFLLLMAVIVNGAHYGFEHTRYQEQVYFPFCFIVCFPLVTVLAEEHRPRIQVAGLLLLAAVAVFKLVLIAHEGRLFKARTYNMEAGIAAAQKQEGSKFRVAMEQVSLTGMTEPNWSYAAETLLLSASRPGQKTVTICTSDDWSFGDNASTITDTRFFFRRWNIEDDDALNPHYFTMQHGPYRELAW